MFLDRRSWASTLALASLVGVIAGCGGSGTAPGASPSAVPTSSSSTEGAEIVTLPAGKDDLALPPGDYRSPDGFYPTLVVAIENGWTSVHRGADGFDVGRSTEPDGGLVVAVAFLVPTDVTAAAALDAVRAEVPGRSTPVSASIGDLTADGLDVDGGTGQLVASAAAGIALDAVPGGRVRVLAVEVNGSPVVVAVLAPDRSVWDEVWPGVQAMLESVQFG